MTSAPTVVGALDVTVVPSYRQGATENVPNDDIAAACSGLMRNAAGGVSGVSDRQAS